MTATRSTPPKQRPGATWKRLSLAGEFFAFPLVWMIIGAALIVIGDGVLVGIGSEAGDTGTIVGALSGAALSLVFYVVVIRFIARRRMPELVRRTAPRDLITGLGIGAGFILLSFALVVAFGGFSAVWHPINPVRTILIAAAVNLGAAISEELLFRGIILQALERMLGPWAALGLSAALFGVLHLFNPGASLWSSFAIAVEAGLLLGAAFVWKRSLWLVVGLHFAWNTLEQLLGIPVSGHRDPGLLLSSPHGPELLSGGSFGIEASIIPVLISITLVVLLLRGAVSARRRVRIE